MGLPLTHGVQLAHAFDVGVVVIVSARTQDEKIATASFLAEPAKGLVKVLAAAHHGGSCHRTRCAVSLVAQTNVLIGGSHGCVGEKEYGQEKREDRRPANFQRHDFDRNDLVRKQARTIYRGAGSAVYSFVAAIS